MKVLAEQLNPTIGDLKGNREKVLEGIKRGRIHSVDIVLFPELTLTGYPPEDLLLDSRFIDAVEALISQIAPFTEGLFVAVGFPRRNPTKKEKGLFNSVALFADGKLLGFQDKVLLPTYDVFDERRFFEPGAKELPVWPYRGKKIGVTICEDIWEHAKAVEETHYQTDPILSLKGKGIDLLLNLSASPYSFNRKKGRLSVVQAAAKELGCPVVLCNQVGANDQLIFDGHSLFVDGTGKAIQVAKGFEEDHLAVDFKAPQIRMEKEDPVGDLYEALVLGVRDYFQKQGFSQAILGLSGGIDSAVCAAIAQEALGAPQVLALSLPSRYSSKESLSDAKELAAHLGIGWKKIDIDPLFQSYLDLLEPFFEGRSADITEENLQSRIRAMILMAFSNKFGSLLLATGNKTEMAMGYTTLYGDMAGGLAVLHDVTKLKVYELARYINRKKEVIPQAILEKEPSAELRPNQKTTESLFPFEILDPVIEDYIERGISLEEIAKKRNVPYPVVKEIGQKIHLAEYKRRQAPLSLRVSSKAFNKGRLVPVIQRWVVPESL